MCCNVFVNQSCFILSTSSVLPWQGKSFCLRQSKIGCDMGHIWYVANVNFTKLCTQCKCGDGSICLFLCKFGHRHLCIGCRPLWISYLQWICTRQVQDKFNFPSSETCSKLIFKTCYPQARCKLFQQVVASLQITSCNKLDWRVFCNLLTTGFKQLDESNRLDANFDEANLMPRLLSQAWYNLMTNVHKLVKSTTWIKSVPCLAVYKALDFCVRSWNPFLLSCIPRLRLWSACLRSSNPWINQSNPFV